MSYSYNQKCANAVRVWRTDCHIPTKWRETPEKENLFREGIQVEFNPLAPSPTAYAAWVYVRDEGELLYWLDGRRWETAECETTQDVANLLLPPTTALRAEMVGLGRGWGLMSDIMIDAADRLIKTALH